MPLGIHPHACKQATLIRVGDADGQAEYGSAYYSYSRLATEHVNHAGDKVCDHLHDGMGFVPGHISVTRILEVTHGSPVRPLHVTGAYAWLPALDFISKCRPYRGMSRS